jgi:DNA ligase 1
MKFSKFSHYLAQIESTDKRLKMTEILADLFKNIEADEIDKACYLSMGELAPKFKNLQLNLAQKMMERALASILNLQVSDINSHFKNTGDLGETFFQLLQSKPNLINDENLTINQVYEKLVEVAKEEGQGSQDRKINGIVNLLKSVDSLSARFLVRIPLKKLRLGFSAMTILDALSWSSVGDKSLRGDLEFAYNVQADVGEIAQIFKSEGIKTLQKITPQVGVPIRPSRATPLTSPKEILEKTGGVAAAEPKFDGFRIQVHFDRQQNTEESQDNSLFEDKDKKAFVQVYSRNLDNITYMFPDLVKAVQNLPADSFILDGETVAFDTKTGKLLDFQETVKRKRKHNIDTVKDEIPLKAFIFDLLYLNGKSLIKESQKDRYQALAKLFKNFKNRHFILTPQKLIDNPADFDTYFNQIKEEGLEGLMLKKTDAPYKAGARDFTWIKYKVAMKSELADTIDGIVMGYFKGEGKWSKFGLGKILLGVPSENKIYALSKVGSGLSENTIKEIVKKCEALKVTKMPSDYQVDKSLIPDVWVQPEIVVEIRADSISRSSLYQAGLSLRFPRFIRFRNKSIDEATSLDQIKNFSK